MARTARGITISTLQDMWEEGHTLRAHCGVNCGHSQELDLLALIKQFGPDYSPVGNDRLRNALRCTKCGRKGCQITSSTNVRCEEDIRRIDAERENRMKALETTKEPRNP